VGGWCHGGQRPAEHEHVGGPGSIPSTTNENKTSCSVLEFGMLYSRKQESIPCVPVLLIPSAFFSLLGSLCSFLLKLFYLRKETLDLKKEVIARGYAGMHMGAGGTIASADLQKSHLQISSRWSLEH
jgi:hypothetical protein